MAQLNGQLENIKQVVNNTKYEINKLTNITETGVQKILIKQELSTKQSICQMSSLQNLMKNKILVHYSPLF
ncbi:hypothetical protein DOY81_005005 [Sarcophaga bullata]|nr:hypothetical protein DOY81_005005 [Sarcophaga bullata]